MRRPFSRDDERAFATLYERHRAGVLAVCLGVLGSRQDAEDAAQEAFISLAVALRSNPPRDPRAWLARVARNAAIDLVRRRPGGECVADELPERAAHPDGVPKELQSVLAGIRELPETQRTALLMRELGGHSYREIASLLEIDQDAVRGLIARARIGLRDHREASELPCSIAREAAAAEPRRRPRDRAVRRHIRGCVACQAYVQALREDARTLRGLLPFSGGGAAGGGALLGGLGAKGAILGGAATQLGTACAVSVCAVGSVILIGPHTPPRGHRRADPAFHSHQRARATPAPQPTRALATAPGTPAALPVNRLPVASSTASVPAVAHRAWSVTGSASRSRVQTGALQGSGGLDPQNSGQPRTPSARASTLPGGASLSPPSGAGSSQGAARPISPSPIAGTGPSPGADGGGNAPPPSSEQAMRARAPSPAQQSPAPSRESDPTLAQRS